MPRLITGPPIFVSLLPFIVTPLVGSLVLFRMVDGGGVIRATLQWLFDDTALSRKVSAPLTWTMLIIYGIRHTLPLSFIVFYAGLQTVPKDPVEAAMIDGANNWQILRYVTVPHLKPLMTFVALMLLMDNFRLLEPIIRFSAGAHSRSLSRIIYNDLRESGSPICGAAGATSMTTIIGVMILLTPVLIRTWRDHRAKP